MHRIQISHKLHRIRPQDPLPLDPRDPAVVRAKDLAREREGERKEGR